MDHQDHFNPERRKADFSADQTPGDLPALLVIYPVLSGGRVEVREGGNRFTGNMHKMTVEVKSLCSTERRAVLRDARDSGDQGMTSDKAKEAEHVYRRTHGRQRVPSRHGGHDRDASTAGHSRFRD